jgi:hypothetical protein
MIKYFPRGCLRREGDTCVTCSLVHTKLIRQWKRRGKGEGKAEDRGTNIDSLHSEGLFKVSKPSLLTNAECMTSRLLLSEAACLTLDSEN